MDKNIIKYTEHREYPLPSGPWLMVQHWEHILFLHYPVEKEVMAAKLPPGLELDTFDGDAWISVIPFRVSKMRLRKMPRAPYFGSYLELNVRTYVKKNGIKGVYFFSLDASKLFAVIGARMVTLPYFYGSMSMKKIDGTFHCYSRRRGKESLILKGNYQPFGDPFYPEKDSLQYWLSERYFLWTFRNGSLYRGGIHHLPWQIQQVNITIGKQSYTSFVPDNALSSQLLACYAKSKTALMWATRKEE